MMEISIIGPEQSIADMARFEIGVLRWSSRAEGKLPGVVMLDHPTPPLIS
jgi:hypothetical protein